MTFIDNQKLSILCCHEGNAAINRENMYTTSDELSILRIFQQRKVAQTSKECCFNCIQNAVKGA